MKQKCLVIFSLILSGATLAFPQIALNPVASRAIGQPNLVPETSNPNWVDGREFFNPEGIALDTSVSPPIVYVADTVNNRVMAWQNATGFTNGQPADLIIGPPDRYTTAASGPGGTFSTGFNFPVGVTVLNGDLYVADTGNNRILRFRKPFAQPNGNVFPDLWLGQPSLTSSTANYTGSLSANGLHISGGFQSYLAFDSSGDLWVSDAGNNRVLEFSASSISCSNCGGMAATVVIGQPNFTSNYPALVTGNASSGVIGNQFNVPSAVAFDAAGRLYVADGGVSAYPGRVLVFSPPFQPGGMSATAIMGVFAPSATFTSAQFDSTIMASPSGIFFFQDQSVGIIDSGLNRITVFPPFSQWGQGTGFSPQATAFFGQTSFANFRPNGTQSATSVTPQPGPSLFSNPTAAFFSQATNELYLADTGNNRAIVLPVLSGDGLGPATRVLGQDRLNQGSIDLIEGREFQFIEFTSSGSEIQDSGIAIDNSGSTPHLYISDPNNHRVLGFKDIRNLQSSAKADIVIGQPDLGTALCNYPTGDSAQPNISSLCFPKGILVDSQGNLYVADSANGRVLRFPAPFSQTFGQVTADLVLGQPSFTSSIKDPTNSTMSSPYGLAITGTNGMLVSDLAYNRVLYIPFSANGTFAAGTDNGRAATKVFGQQSFSSIGAGSSAAALSSPHHISCDSSGQLYVADTGNSRIAIFGDPNSAQTAASGQPSVLSINGLSTPEGVYVNPTTGEIWVANTQSHTAVRYPKFELLPFNQSPIDPSPFSAYGNTLAVAQDQFGDLVLADATNRVAMYYPGIIGVNGADLANADKLIAPGMLATIFPMAATANTTSGTLGGVTATNTSSTWPTTLGGIQLLFNGTPAPLNYVSSTQINFQVPNGAPVTGTASATVVNATTGQIFGAGLLNLNSVSPGIFICGAATGNLRQACVDNQDGTVNSGTNAAARGSIISIYATGEGFVPNAPPDGTPATGALSSPASLRVFMSFNYVDEITLQSGESNGGNFIKYSGLAPGLVGVWQVNVQIPLAIGVGNQIPIALVLNGDVADPDVHSGYSATIAVK